MLWFAWFLQFCSALLALIAGSSSSGSALQGGARETLSPAEKKEAIERLVEALKSTYVFPEVAERMSASLRSRSEKGAYDAIGEPESFARTLTDDLQAVSHDKHMRVRAEGPAERPASARPGPPRSPEEFRRRNFGFQKIEILPGNVGYIDLRTFAPADLGGDTVAAAMDFLANTDALVLDLRENGGGQPDMVQLVCSYFFGAQPVHLNDLYLRPSDETHQFWTLPWLPGRRYLDREVYVLTSRSTFSGAEECAYDLKTQQRAKLVGETTGGGAHPGDMVRLSEHLAAFVPAGRAINPVTKTDWEGTGVEPDFQVPADLALATAQELALKKLLDECQDAIRREALSGALARVGRELAALKTSKSQAEPASSERKR